MNSEYSIFAVFKLIDEFSAPVSAVEKKLTKMQQISSVAERQFSAIGNKLSVIGKNAFNAGTNFVVNGIKNALPEYLEYESTLHAAGAAFGDLDTKSENYVET